MKKYSLVIYPETIIDVVKNMKQALKNRIGWYNSSNSLAHFSICEFQIEDEKLENVIEIIEGLVKGTSVKEVMLNSFGYYSSGAFYIKPSDDSKVYLKTLFKKVCEGLSDYVKLGYQVVDPHLSIGRRLNEEQLALAKEMFQEIQEHFFCDGVMLRVFNPTRKQYDLKKFVSF